MEVKVWNLHTRQKSTVRTRDKCRWQQQEDIGPGKSDVSNLSEQKFPFWQTEKGRNSLYMCQPTLWQWYLCSVYLVNKNCGLWNSWLQGNLDKTSLEIYFLNSKWSYWIGIMERSRREIKISLYSPFCFYGFSAKLNLRHKLSIWIATSTLNFDARELLSVEFLVLWILVLLIPLERWREVETYLSPRSTSVSTSISLFVFHKTSFNRSSAVS